MVKYIRGISFDIAHFIKKINRDLGIRGKPQRENICHTLPLE